MCNGCCRFHYTVHDHSILAQEEPVAAKMQAEEKAKAKKESEEWVVDKSTEITKQHNCCRSDCMRNTSEKEE